ncbi:2-hydroxyacid dehydrogenase family protein [Bacillus sp. AFS053548]|uniref:2-hydroxyacid dehydrogenase family protein n=1 Tax=Bacillus sp. AFS053548 TaxID=2033505 RepID=UPI000BFE41BF|nr:2-hydroxyacid dehydrogenase family protein [Bacillus sp. AFS053548]PGM56603.1 hydroxyacid dehydrogenase [Bacillus sp. AFS053548]
MAHILVAGKIPEKAEELLKDHHVIVYENEKLITEDELCELVGGVDSILSLLSTPITKRVIDAAKNVKIIANYGAGFNNIDVDYATSKGIHVTNTPLVSTDATAELTFGILLAVSRRIVEGDELCRTKGFEGWAPLFFRGTEVSGKTLGIFGFGNIGQAVAKRAKAFNMNIIYHQPRRISKELEQELNATYVSLKELLQTSDYITLHCPYKPELHHLFGKEEFSMMKDTAFFINAARGPLANEQELVDALKDGVIAGAALDVFEFEPKITEELISLTNVVLTPHIGNATYETRDAMSEIAAKNIIEVMAERPPISPVNQILVKN